MAPLLFVTKNENKVREARQILGMEVEQAPVVVEEIQSSDIHKVVERKARYAFAKLGKPVIVEDTSFHMACLSGFPGPFIKFFQDAVKYEGICRLARELGDSHAWAECCFAYCDSSGPRVFCGRVDGKIADKPRGRNGFGWDIVFIPDGHDRTFAEMPAAEKNAISHRKLALEKLRAFLSASR